MWYNIYKLPTAVIVMKHKPPKAAFAADKRRNKFNDTFRESRLKSNQTYKSLH